MASFSSVAPGSTRPTGRSPAAHAHTLALARTAFLPGCSLPAAWVGQPQWRVLDTCFGDGLRFLATWAAWQADPARPRLLHFVALQGTPDCGAAVLQAAAATAEPVLQPLAHTLHAQLWGLLPGLHRIALDGGQVLLTLCVGDGALAQLRQQAWTVDSLFLNGLGSAPEASDKATAPAPHSHPLSLNLNAHAAKALARCCHRGTRLVALHCSTSDADLLAQAGFALEPPSASGTGSSQPPGLLRASYQPRWEPRTARSSAGALAAPCQPARCMVIGAGLAGAATAASLARRGWQVQVLDAAATPAAGASGLPAGVFAPHPSPDDNVLSRISRSGVRAMLQHAAPLLQAGVDWQPDGVLERRLDAALGLPANWHSGPGADWSQQAGVELLRAAGLANGELALWHLRAGWVRPARLVAALLAQPGVAWCPNARVAQLQHLPQAPAPKTTAPPDSGIADGENGNHQGVWRALDAHGTLLAEAELVVLAAGPACNALLQGVLDAPASTVHPPHPHRLPLQPIRGQLSWGLHTPSAKANANASHALPPFPVNGHGGLVANVPMDGGNNREAQALAWHMGSTFERDADRLPLTAAEQAAAHASNWQQLQTLLPGAASALQSAFDPAAPASAHTVRAWASVRCTAPDRLPLVGPVNASALPGLWVCTAMGARGLTRAVLCGELLAARLHGEPLPLEARLAQTLATERL